MRCIFIYNPISGKGKVIKHLQYIEETLKKKYDEVVVYRSKSAQDIKEKAFESCTKYDAIIFSGGDGTFNDVVCGVSASPIRPPLGYIPMGTGNDNSHNLNIPRSVKGALKVILNNQTIHHDVGKVNDTYFVYALALGACTATSYTTKQDAKKAIGKLAYVWNGMEEFFSPDVKKITIVDKDSDKVIETTCPLILVLNTISVGGMKFNRLGHLNDGVFDVILIKNGTGHGRFNIIWFFLNGLLGFRRNKRYTVSLKSSHFSINVEGNATWCADGEKGPSGSVEIENLHDHIQIFAPKKSVIKQNK